MSRVNQEKYVAAKVLLNLKGLKQSFIARALDLSSAQMSWINRSQDYNDLKRINSERIANASFNRPKKRKYSWSKNVK